MVLPFCRLSLVKESYLYELKYSQDSPMSNKLQWSINECYLSKKDTEIKLAVIYYPNNHFTFRSPFQLHEKYS